MKLTTALLALSLAPVWAQEAAKETLEPIPVRAGKTRAADNAIGVVEVLKNFTVAAGRTKNLALNMNFVGADRASISLACASNVNLKDVRLVVWWGNPLADWVSATDIIFGSTFAFANMGGQTVPVYGSHIEVEVRNGGSTEIACDQLSVYAVVLH